MNGLDIMKLNPESQLNPVLIVNVPGNTPDNIVDNVLDDTLDNVFLDKEIAAAIAYSAPLMPLHDSLKLRLMERLGLPSLPIDLTVDLTVDLPVDSPLKALLDWSLADLIAAASKIKNWPSLASPEDATYGPWKIDKPTRQMAYFVRAPRAGALPTHHHATGEVVLVLEGDFTVEGVCYQAGDRLLSAADTIHQPTTTGCLVLILSSLDDSPVETIR